MKVNPFLKTLWYLLLLIVSVFLILKAPFYAAVSLLVVIGCIYSQKKHSRKEPEVKLELADFIAQYGNPEEHIVTNPTRGNEIDGAILCYRRLGLLVINGQVIKQSDIKGLSLKNEEIPYLPNDYQIQIEIRSEDCPVLFVSVGSDLNWAGEVVRQLQTALLRH